MKNVASDPEAFEHRALGHPTRLRLLRLLEAAGPLDARELAERLDLRPAGVRRHLDPLLRAGLVSAAPGTTRGPGRPPLLYAAGPAATRERQRVGYPLLADMLAGTLNRLEDYAAAEAEGHRWGRALVERPLPPEAPDADRSGAVLTAMLERLGFAPETTRVASGLRVDIRRCPFLTTATQYPGVVCSLHLGLMRGALAELDAPLEAERLDPLVTPTLCVGHLRPTR